MGFLLVIATLITCLYAVKRSWAAAALLIVLLPLEQVLQSYYPFLRSASGSWLVNVLIAVIVAVSWLHARITVPPLTTLFQCKVPLISTVLFTWAFLTCAWSPSSENALEIITKGLPYYLVIVVLGSQLVSTLPDLRRCLYLTLALGLLVQSSFIFNPEFDFRNGRLALDLGGGYRSSSLAIGESGGVSLIIATLMRDPHAKRVWLFFRLSAAVIGGVVLIMSGARGQLIAAVLASATFFAFANSQRSAQRTIGSLVMVVLLLLFGWIIFDAVLSLLPTLASTRFSTQELLYGASSASGRVGNVSALFSAWLQSPTAPFIGLGYVAFGSISGGSAIEVYCHNVYAEVIFELGLPGAICMAAVIYIATNSAIQLLRMSNFEPSDRAAVTVLMGLIAYQSILLAKQGSLWGSFTFFLYLAIIERIQRHSELTLTTVPVEV